jgi:hypothetical protein
MLVAKGGHTTLPVSIACPLGPSGAMRLVCYCFCRFVLPSIRFVTAPTCPGTHPMLGMININKGHACTVMHMQDLGHSHAPQTKSITNPCLPHCWNPRHCTRARSDDLFEQAVLLSHAIVALRTRGHTHTAHLCTGGGHTFNIATSVTSWWPHEFCWSTSC